MNTLTNDQLNSVYNSVHKYIELGNKLYDKKINNISVEIDLNGANAGMAITRSNGYHSIRLNQHLIISNFERFLNDVIPHEIAHIFAFLNHPNLKRHHGKEWKSVMANFGVEAITKHDMKIDHLVKTNRYKISCCCGTSLISSHRRTKMLKGISYKCSKCNTFIELI